MTYRISIVDQDLKMIKILEDVPSESIADQFISDYREQHPEVDNSGCSFMYQRTEMADHTEYMSLYNEGR